MYKQVTGAHLKPYSTPLTSPLKKPATITPEEHCLSKQIDQVDLPGIALSGILQVQEYGYKSEEEPKSIKLFVKSKDSIFSDQCYSQIQQQHTSTQQWKLSSCLKSFLHFQILGSNGVELHFKSDELDILEGKWLTDNFISAYQRIKKKQFPRIGGSGGGCKTVLKFHHMAFI